MISRFIRLNLRPLGLTVLGMFLGLIVLQFVNFGNATVTNWVDAYQRDKVDACSLKTFAGGKPGLRLSFKAFPTDFTQSNSVINDVAFSPDGSLLASASSDNTVRLWQLSTGKLAKQFSLPRPENEEEAYSVAFSSDGKTLVSGNDFSAKLWDIESGRLLQSFGGHNGYQTYGVAFSPDNKIVATANVDHRIQLYDSTNGKILNVLNKHKSAAFSVAFSPNGNKIASVGMDSNLILWDASNGNELHTFKANKIGTNSLDFDRSGDFIATTGNDGYIRIFNVVTRKQAAILKGHAGISFAPNFSPDNAYLVSTGLDKKVIIWSTYNWQPIASLDLSNKPDYQSLALAPDGKSLAIGYKDGSVSLWQIVVS